MPVTKAAEAAATELFNDSFRKAWVKLFDPSTSPDLKAALSKVIREGESNFNLASDIDNYNRKFTELGFDHLERGTRVGAIMTSGYLSARAIHQVLDQRGIAGDFFTIGYSSGRYDHTKHFADGISMIGKIFATAADLEMILSGPHSPILLVDDFVDKGITIATLVIALKTQLGFQGPIHRYASAADYIANNSHHVHSWNEGDPQSVAKYYAMHEIGQEPIVDETGAVFSSLERR